MACKWRSHSEIMESVGTEPPKQKICKRLGSKMMQKKEMKFLEREHTAGNEYSFCFPPVPVSSVKKRLTVATFDPKTLLLQRLSRRMSFPQSAVREPRSKIGRLRMNVVPTRYTLCIKPNLEYSKFEGSVIIECECVGNSSSVSDLAQPSRVPTVKSTGVRKIILNSLDLVIGKAVWIRQNKKHVASEIIYKPETEHLVLTFDPPIPAPSKGALQINFSGNINNFTSGLYRSRYSSQYGEGKYYGVTKFEPIFARKCFPCFDEPALRAKFDLSLILPKNLTALSNKHVRSAFPHRTELRLHIVEFETTPVMSPHLLGFAIGEFDKVSGHVGSGADFVSINVYTALGLADKATEAIEWAKSLHEFYKTYFDVPYALKKIDILGVTSEPEGALENWGLIVCDQQQLLTRNANDLEESICRARALSHKLVQQWLGNLVSIVWWNHLWWKEGLATFFEHYSITSLQRNRSEYNIWIRFISGVFVKALEADTHRITHPLDTEVRYPTEIREIHDKISNRKAASIIRMCYHYIGEKTFQRGIQEFINRFSYSNASSTDLLAVLEEMSEKPVIEVMESWTKQTGFPLVKVEGSQYDTNGNCRIITLQQDWFFKEAIYIGEKSASASKTKWVIPIQISLGHNPSIPIKEILMDKRTQKFKIQDITSQEWFLLNPGHVGFYRVKYPSEMMVFLVQGIRTKIIHPEDRIGLLNDLHALCSAGYSNISELLTMLEGYVEEEHALVWQEINHVVGSLDLLLQGTDFYPKFKSFTRHLYQRINEKLGWKPSAELDSANQNLRLLVLSQLIKYGHAEVLAEGHRLYRLWLTENSENVTGIVMQAGMAASNNEEDVCRVLLRRFGKSQNDEEKRQIILALGQAKIQSVITSILSFGTSTNVTPEETILFLDAMMRNPLGKSIAWEYFKENIISIHSRFMGAHAENEEIIHQLVGSMTKYLIHDEAVWEINHFFHLHHFPGTEKVIQESVDNIMLYMTWLKRERERLVQYLTPYEF